MKSKSRIKKNSHLKKARSFPLTSNEDSIRKNKQAQWDAYHELQKEAQKAWKKLRADVKRNAPKSTIIQDRNRLALLLGECSYMTHECMNFEAISKKAPAK